MSSCYTVPSQVTEFTSAENRLVCPACGAKGKAVDTQTVKAMLAVSLQILRSTSYHFCPTPDCPVVYFACDAEQTLGEADLREKVYQKHLVEDEVWVCYCFRHTPGTIRAEMKQSGSSKVMDAITAGIRAGRCACEIRNPQGSCCLGNVRALAAIAGNGA